MPEPLQDGILYIVMHQAKTRPSLTQNRPKAKRLLGRWPVIGIFAALLLTIAMIQVGVLSFLVPTLPDGIVSLLIAGIGAAFVFWIALRSHAIENTNTASKSDSEDQT